MRDDNFQKERKNSHGLQKSRWRRSIPADGEDPFLTSTKATRATGMGKILIVVKK
jgi:hypothetical protein